MISREVGKRVPKRALTNRRKSKFGASFSPLEKVPKKAGRIKQIMSARGAFNDLWLHPLSRPLPLTRRHPHPFVSVTATAHPKTRTTAQITTTAPVPPHLPEMWVGAALRDRLLQRNAAKKPFFQPTSSSNCFNMTTAERRKINSVVVGYLWVLDKGKAAQTEQSIRTSRKLEVFKRWRITPHAVQGVRRVRCTNRRLQWHGGREEQRRTQFFCVAASFWRLSTHLQRVFKKIWRGSETFQKCETFIELLDEWRQKRQLP